MDATAPVPSPRWSPAVRSGALHGTERRDPADEAVHQDGDPFQRPAEENAAQARKVEPAKLREDVEGVSGVWRVDRDAPADGVHFAGKPFIGEARAPAGHGFDGLAQ